MEKWVVCAQSPGRPAIHPPTVQFKKVFPENDHIDSTQKRWKEREKVDKEKKARKQLYISVSCKKD